MTSVDLQLATPPEPLERRGEDLVQAVLAAGVLVASGALARQGTSTAEGRVFAAANRLPNWLEAALWLPMQLGSLWGPFVTGAVIWRRDRSWRSALGTVVVGVTAWRLASVVKRAVRRGRPDDELSGVVLRWGTPRDGFGFVSGHATVAFATAGVAAPALPGGPGLLLRALAPVVGFARMHVGAHLPLDVVGGAALGHLLAMIWNLAVGVEPAAVPSEPGRSDAVTGEGGEVA
jgi:membrane-associated phospholipid phosphatase